MRVHRILTCVGMLLLAVVQSPAADSPAGPLTLVVMDPLAAPLACDCVQGYAQRKYELLGNFLSQKLKRPVKVFWSESLVKAINEQTGVAADLVIGKHSVVLYDAKKSEIRLAPVASLTGQDGSTTQTGLIVVRSGDPAKSVADLAGYRIFFGPEDCDEKSLAPMQLLRQHGVALPTAIETCPACSDAASKLVALEADARAAAVISSYAEPLLQGCGTVKKGDLRVVGVSEPVPFVTAFVNEQLTEAERSEIKAALLDVATDPTLLIALETGAGFVEYEAVPPPGADPAAAKTVSQTSSAAKKKN